MPRDGVSRRPHLLIARAEGGCLEVLTISTAGGEEALAVFSFEEEAEMYLHLCLGASGHDWRVRQTSSGELASILCGPCREARAVALDPLPEACCGTLNGLLSVRRERFLRTLLGEGASSPRRPTSPVSV